MDLIGIEGRRSEATGVNQLRVDTKGGLMAHRYSGKYTEAALAGRLFVVASQGAVTTSKDDDVGWKGLGIGNPIGSGKNLILHEFGWALIIVGSDDGLVGLATCAIGTDFEALLTQRNCKWGGGPSVAYCDAGATIEAPILERVCGTHGMGATTTEISKPPQIVDLAGSMILAPGRAVVTWTSEIVTSGLQFHFVWEEVDA